MRPEFERALRTRLSLKLVPVIREPTALLAPLLRVEVDADHRRISRVLEVEQQRIVKVKGESDATRLFSSHVAQVLSSILRFFEIWTPKIRCQSGRA